MRPPVPRPTGCRRMIWTPQEPSPPPRTHTIIVFVYPSPIPLCGTRSLVRRVAHQCTQTDNARRAPMRRRRHHAPMLADDQPLFRPPLPDARARAPPATPACAARPIQRARAERPPGAALVKRSPCKQPIAWRGNPSSAWSLVHLSSCWEGWAVLRVPARNQGGEAESVCRQLAGRCARNRKWTWRPACVYQHPPLQAQSARAFPRSDSFATGTQGSSPQVMLRPANGSWVSLLPFSSTVRP